MFVARQRRPEYAENAWPEYGENWWLDYGENLTQACLTSVA
tara:strand:+ start:2547 stop:2669 length:123 start_codon:yes stop_codon:yes gene_type:complete